MKGKAILRLEFIVQNGLRKLTFQSQMNGLHKLTFQSELGDKLASASGPPSLSAPALCMFGSLH
eukprot:scaffold10237_cov71-Cyclotella_meneghiniana.AAC.11